MSKFIDVLAKRYKKPDDGEEITCVWNMGTACRGDIYIRDSFASQLVVNMCNGHYFEHCRLMVVHTFSGKNIEEIVELSPGDMAQLFKDAVGADEFTVDVCKTVLAKVKPDIDLTDMSEEDLYYTLSKNL